MKLDYGWFLEPPSKKLPTQLPTQLPTSPPFSPPVLPRPVGTTGDPKQYRGSYREAVIIHETSHFNPQDVAL